jgi:hypothetical protein
VIFCLFCANFLSLSTLFENRKDATLSLSLILPILYKSDRYEDG